MRDDRPDHVEPLDEVTIRARLAGVGRAVVSLTYAVGVLGVVVGARAWVDGDPVVAAAVWVLTFAAGAVLQLAGLLARGVVVLLSAVERLERDVDVLASRLG